MDLYSLFFVLGASGMVAMALLGVAGSRGGGRAHSSHGARTVGARTGARAASARVIGPRTTGARTTTTQINSAGRGAAGARISGTKPGAVRTSARANSARGARTSGGARGNLKDAVSAWLSPRVLFTLALGIGATGLLLAPVISNDGLRAVSSFAGGLFLEKALVAPLWELLMQFGSAPARTLESAAFEEAVAITAFDSQGCGMISIVLDGHEMRALARLQPDPDGAQPRVKSGDTLLVESVDAARGQCVVSRLQ